MRASVACSLESSMISCTMRASRSDSLASRFANRLTWSGSLDALTSASASSADGPDRRLQLMGDVGDEVAAHLLEPVGLGAVLREQQHVARSRGGRHAPRGGCSRRRTGPRLSVSSCVIGSSLRRTRSTSADELGMHERAVPHEAEAHRARRGLDDGVRGVEHDPRGLEGVEHLVDAVRHRGGGRLHGAMPAAGCRKDHREDAGAQQHAERKSGWYQPLRGPWGLE